MADSETGRDGKLGTFVTSAALRRRYGDPLLLTTDDFDLIVPRSDVVERLRSMPGDGDVERVVRKTLEERPAAADATTWFSLLTQRQLRRVHRSVAELEGALLRYAARTNETAKPFRWTKSADDILQSVKRFCLQTSNSEHYPSLMNGWS